MLPIVIGAVCVLCAVVFFGKEFFGGMFGLYRIVPPNEAHIRVMGSKKDIFSHRNGNKSSYWFIPFITKVNTLPLHNLTVPVNDIKLNDKNMAKFHCDVMCFVNIQNIELAAERLFLSDAENDMGFDFVKLSEDFRAIMESITRTVVTKDTILEIYMNRQFLTDAITKEVVGVFPKWGIELINLELKHIKDAPDSSIIADIERKNAAEIRRDADIKIAQTNKESAIAQAENNELAQKRKIQADEAIGLAQQAKNLSVAEAEAKANQKTIDAKTTLEVGQAKIERQKIEQQSEAEKTRQINVATGKAEQVKLEGEAAANVVKVTKLADAEGTSALADALAKFNDAAMGVKKLEIGKDIALGKFSALAAIAKEADIKWIMSGANAQSFFGLDLTAEGGANLEQFLKESGVDIEKIKQLLPVKK